jgi:hypothetical protein
VKTRINETDGKSSRQKYDKLIHERGEKEQSAC